MAEVPPTTWRLMCWQSGATGGRGRRRVRTMFVGVRHRLQSRFVLAVIGPKIAECPDAIELSAEAAVESETSATLLARLRQVPADQAAWAQFADRYGRKLYAWCRRWNLQGADAEDLTQDVLLKLAEKMQTFVYDPTK